MQDSLRKVLIDSHVAAIAIAILIFSSLDAAFLALWGPVSSFLFALATGPWGNSPYAYLNPGHVIRSAFSSDVVNLSVSLSILVEALAGVLTAYLLSRWADGVGPLRCLGSYRDKLSRKTNRKTN
jgi:hypothetical protein